MQIFLNGEAKNVDDGMTIQALIATMTDDPRGIAIERNLEIVPKAAHAETLIAEGDRIEIVQFVGGG